MTLNSIFFAIKHKTVQIHRLHNDGAQFLVLVLAAAAAAARTHTRARLFAASGRVLFAAMIPSGKHPAETPR